MAPKVSVIMSVFNGAKYLNASLDSILEQTFSDFEFIIIDDGSSDRSWQILTHYAAQDSRIKLFQNEQNLGLTRSLNKALRLAKGTYIARQDADDLALPERFQRQVTLLESDASVVLASSIIELIDADGKPQHHIPSDSNTTLAAWHLLFYNCVGGHSQVMFRRQQVVELGGYSEEFRYSQDYALWCRLIKRGRIVILPEVLQQRRVHAQSISVGKKPEQQVYSLTQSKNNIAELLGEELSLEDVKVFRSLFMIPVYRYAFPDLHPPVPTITQLHRRLKKIHKVFFQRSPQTMALSELANQTRQLTCQQFLCWMNHVGFRQHFLLKLKLWMCAFSWCPLLVMRTVWGDIWKGRLSNSQSLQQSLEVT